MRNKIRNIEDNILYYLLKNYKFHVLFILKIILISVISDTRVSSMLNTKCDWTIPLLYGIGGVPSSWYCIEQTIITYIVDKTSLIIPVFKKISTKLVT